jgi:LmbE family N-acetylglucosaminyl deacetylase
MEILRRSRANQLKLVLALTATLVIAQQPEQHLPPQADAMEIAADRGTPGMERWLRALQTRASLLMITAHPDDEDGGMLAYVSRGQGARVSMLTLNRGEGGQDVMSSDMNDALGLIRTQELLAADRYLCLDQYFTSAIDFGFSKTREEALEKWGHDRILADAVRVVRMTRPLVITSVFVGGATDGHGQHQVAGETAQEVYLAAGDPTKFPEQIRAGLRAWRPLKVYGHVPFFTATDKGMYDYAIDKYVPVRFFDYVTQKASDKEPTPTVDIQEGLPAPGMGLTFLQVAREGLGLQKTQNGGGLTPPAAPQSSGYHRYGSRVPAQDKEQSLFDGIDTSLNGIATLAQGETTFLKTGLAAISNFVAVAARSYSPDHPTAIAPTLADGLKATRALISQVRASQLADPGKSDVLFELGVKEQQFEKALAVAFSISVDASIAPPPATGPMGGRGGPSPTFTIAIPNQSFAVESRIYNQNAEPLKVASVELLASDGKNWSVKPEGENARTIAPGKEEAWRFVVKVPAAAQLTRPYFTRPNEEQPYYNITDERYRNLPLPPYPLEARVQFDYNGVKFEVSKYIQTNERISGIGTVQNPLLVAPAISVTVTPSAGAVPLSARQFAFTATVHSNVKGPSQGRLHLELPQGWTSQPAEAAFSLARDGEDQPVAFTIHPNTVKAAEYDIAAIADYNGQTYREGYHMTGYPGVRPYPLYKPSTYRAVGVDVKTADGLRIGFIPGTGDDVPKALENLGQTVRVLSETDITQGDLSAYDAIVLGVRAYAVRPELRTANGRLMDYVKKGGVMIVQYNLQSFDGNYGPYPFSLGNAQKVVDENAPVTLLDPASPVFTWPNKISPNDFNGWVEERGHGFMATWDSHYTPLVEVHDPDQDPQKGGLLLARYGKGFYIYDAFALYRQLPAGVPGAFRLLANLVSLSKNPAWN